MSQSFRDEAARHLAAVGREIFGLDEVIRLSIVAFYAGGHVLLEGNPGLGKTQLVKTLAAALGFEMKRIQFTPDLMPADITGTFLPSADGAGGFRFVPGPIFTAVLLADEINRATPKTQAAMLEGMAEGRVTVLGKTYDLPRPFFVLATQNPIDHEGTYELPKAQADRFMFKIPMPSPDRATLGRIVDKDAGVRGLGRDGHQLARADRAVAPADPGGPLARFDAVARGIREVENLAVVREHVLSLVLASCGDVSGLDPKAAERVTRLVQATVAYGLGPRAATALMVGSKAWSLLFLGGETRAVGAGLASVALPALRHRLALQLDWEHSYRQLSRQPPDLTGEPLRSRLLAELVMLTAPAKPAGYRDEIKQSLAAVLGSA